MASGTDGDRGEGLSDGEQKRLEALRGARSLADLVALTGADSEHRAYFDAKAEWFDLRGRELDAGAVEGAGAPARSVYHYPDPPGGIPGTVVTVDGVDFWVHGVTHAGTDAERSFLRERVRDLRDGGAWFYCEQGIRELYFEDFPETCAMDDQRWAMRRCRELDAESHLGDLGEEFEGLVEDATELASRFRGAVFSLVDSGSEVYGEEFEAALGDLVSTFLTSHVDAATGEDFASYRLNRAAAEDPAELPALQRYYERRFLPQPVEREWLARHDRELEIFTHARNERMADYAVYHHDTAPEVHLVVGAAHGPGVRYYLERHRDGERTTEGFEPL